jgi:sortase B
VVNIKIQLTKKHWKILYGVCAAVVVCAVIGIVVSRNNGNTAVYDEIRRETVSTPAPTPVTTVEPIPTPTVEPAPVEDNGIRPPDRKIDFAALSKRNSDIIAWLSVAGTKIDYPLVKNRDNTEYLDRDVDGEENAAGAIFMDMANNTAFLDRHTVIYGHNMTDGGMFAGLHQFADKAFFDKHRIIKLYTPDGMREYEIIAAYITDDRNVLYQTDYANDTVFEEYIQSVYANRDMGANLLEKEIGAGDQIITLSTCEQGEVDQIYFVQGVLMKGAE